MAVTVPGTLSASLERTSLYLATCWAITRQDATQFFYTDHNAALEFNGETFLPAAGLDASARQKQEALKSDNVELMGAVSGSAITHDDLVAGRYREAQIDEYLIDWRRPFLGYISHSRYWVTTVEFTDEAWVANVAGLGLQLQVKKGSLLSRGCQYTLGDANCTVNTAALTISQTVSVVTSRTQFTTDISAGTYPNDGHWDFGLLVWTSGLNAGLKSEVKTSIAATGALTLFLPTPFAVTASDGFDIYPGCDKTKGDCQDKFSNYVNYGGRPFIPGTDTMIKVARHKKAKSK